MCQIAEPVKPFTSVTPSRAAARAVSFIRSAARSLTPSGSPSPQTSGGRIARCRASTGSHTACPTRCAPSAKPLTRHPEEAEAAFDPADRAGRFLMEAFMYRHNPQTKRLRALIDEGAIGKVHVIRSTFSYSLYDADNIRLRTDVDGGALMDVGCYCVSGSRVAAGAEPVSVYGQAWYGDTGTDWVCTGSMRFPGDVFAIFDCGTALPERDELEVIGSEGSLFLDDPFHIHVPVIEIRRDGGVERIELERD